MWKGGDNVGKHKKKGKKKQKENKSEITLGKLAIVLTSLEIVKLILTTIKELID